MTDKKWKLVPVSIFSLNSDFVSVRFRIITILFSADFVIIIQLNSIPVKTDLKIETMRF